MQLNLFLATTLIMVFLTSASKAHDTSVTDDISSLSILGVAYKEGDDKFYAAIGTLNASSGNLSFAAPSSPYSIDSQLQPCINAKLLNNKKTAYAIQTFDAVNYLYNFNIIDDTGTVAQRNFSKRGKVLSYLVVAWSFSPVHNFLVSIGWPVDSSTTSRTSTEGRFALKNKEDVAEVSFINPSTGAVQLLVNVPGESFLECAAIVSNNWFHYIWLDESNKVFTGSVNLPSSNPDSCSSFDSNSSLDEEFKFLSVAVPDIYGLVINIASSPSLGSSFVVSTEKGYLLLVQPELGIISTPFSILDGRKGKVSLAASIVAGNDQLLTFLKGETNQLATWSNHTIKYTLVDSGKYQVSLANF